MEAMTKLVVQIPAYNEAETIAQVITEIPRQIPGVEQVQVVVIDDGSTDGTAQAALAAGADAVLRHRTNRGLSRAFINGLQFALALGADLIVNTDADHQYPGSAIPSLIAPILNGEADLVIGDRQLAQNEHFSPFKRFLEGLGSWFVRQVSSTQVPDAASGFRAFSRFAALPLQVYNPYSYTLETLIQAGKEKMQIATVPIRTNATPRASRLHRGIIHFLLHQGGAIIRSYVLYQPLRTFLSLGSLLSIAGIALLLRFLAFYITQPDATGRLVQSVSIGGTLILAGIIMVIIGFLGDSLRANRQVAQENMVRLRDAQDLKELKYIDFFLGHPILKSPSNNRD